MPPIGIAKLGERAARISSWPRATPRNGPLGVVAVEHHVVGGEGERRLEVAARRGRRRIVDQLRFRLLPSRGVSWMTTGAPTRMGLRGRRRAADRLNLIRVMPAQGDARSARRDKEQPWQQQSDNRATTRSSSAAGVIGLACAWRAAQRGARVLVLERDAPRRGRHRRRRRDAGAGRRGDLRRGPAARAGARVAPALARSSRGARGGEPACETGYSPLRRAARRARPRRGGRAAPPLRAAARARPRGRVARRRGAAASSSRASAPSFTAASTRRARRRSTRAR